MTPLFEVLLGLVTKYMPEWDLNYPQAPVVNGGVVVYRGALPSTMHMGSARLTLQTGVLVFFDEDHRDGYDSEERRVTITADELAQVRAALPPAS